MAKDPAFLFYSQDWIVGCQTLSMEERGQYITLIANMHQQGRMDEETIRLLVGSLSVRLKRKFRIDSKGFYYNERLEEECLKRSKFTESRRNNGLLGGRPPLAEKTDRLPVAKPNPKATQNHMGNENENEIIVKDDDMKGGAGGKQKSNPEFQPCMKVYHDFILKQTGAPPKITAADGKAMKDIIEYLEKFPNAENKSKSVNQLLEYILQNFNRWDQFHKKQIKLPQISSNLINIVNGLKNGQSLNGTTEQKIGRLSATDAQEFLNRGAIAPLD